MVDFEENVEEIVGTTREAAGGDRVRRGRDRRSRWFRDETSDKTAATAGDERTAATDCVMYADEGSYTIDVRHVEKMVGTTMEKRRMATESDGDETGGPGDETGDKTAPTAGDERKRRRPVGS